MEVSDQLKLRSLDARERHPGTHWMGGWLGPRAGLKAVTKTKYPIFATVGNSTPVFHPVA